jgi:Uma2 family endonuclease
LSEAVDRGAAALRRRLASPYPASVVEIRRPLRTGPRTRVVPDISVFAREGETVPDLVVEMRTESTDRLALGPKRLVYARAGVGDYWFLDPQAGQARRLWTIRASTDYGWPAAMLGPADVLESFRFPALRVPVSELLIPELRRSSERIET